MKNSICPSLTKILLKRSVEPVCEPVVPCISRLLRLPKSPPPDGAEMGFEKQQRVSVKRGYVTTGEEEMGCVDCVVVVCRVMKGVARKRKRAVCRFRRSYRRSLKIWHFLPRISKPAMSSDMLKRLLAALFYGLCSFLIVVVNKTVLTTYKFPSFQFLALGQMFVTLVVLSIAKKLKYIDFPSFSYDIVLKIWPLPLLYVGNLVFGLGGTKRLSLPMFTVLRRFSILMTMIGEKLVLGTHPSIPVQLTVYTMILGSFIAAINDLSFEVTGYTFVLANDFFTAANGVVVKQKLDRKELGKYGLLFYNSLFMFPFSFISCLISEDFTKVLAYEHWNDALFAVQFVLSCIMGFILMHSIMVCTQYNSALTTTIIGCLKNIVVTYLGMIVGGDYIFSLLNFVGLNISIVGSIVYSWITFRDKVPAKELPKIINT